MEEETNMTENQWWKQTQTYHPHLSDDTTDQQTHQCPRLSLQGDSTEIAIRQQDAEGQDLGHTMGGGETIPESTPLHEQRSPMAQNPKEEEISTNTNVAIRHKAESKAGGSPEEADTEMVQTDEKRNRRDNSQPQKTKKIRVDGPGVQPPERKRSKTRRPIHKTDKP